MQAKIYDRLHLHRRHHGFLCDQRPLYPFLRETLIMENIIAGTLSALLFIYLLVAMLRPEKF
jgi:K+-transporting ATPase KdpF subunit